MNQIKYVARLLPLLFMVNALASCNGSTTTSATDSATAAPMDSMPVIKPRIPDSAGIITTPPVNDNNNIVPDSAL